MYPFERKDKILNKIRSEGQITIKKDARRLGVSSATLHRDLSELERLGIIRKVRGGAILSEASQFDTHFDVRLKTSVKEKVEIARKAALVVHDDTSIFLDHSTTVIFLARELRTRHFRRLIIVTNSLAVPSELAGKKGLQIIMTGGIVEEEYKALSGRWIRDILSHFTISQAFASVGAVSLEHGLMTQSHFIYELLPEVFKHVKQINILADRSKFLKVGTFQIAPLSASLRIFTDKGIPKSLREEIEKRGPRVII
jgi:DeoR/GlpR family transcriptional regulator of sugar metabolism